MNVSTDGSTKLLLKSFFSLLLCTYFPRLLQGSRKPPRGGDLTPARQGPASPWEGSHYRSSGRAGAPGEAGLVGGSPGGHGQQRAGCELPERCQGTELAAVRSGERGSGCLGRHLAGKGHLARGWRSRGGLG